MFTVLILFLYLQIDRPLPPLPQKVVYYSLDEVTESAKKQPGWSVLKSSPSVLIVGKYCDTAESIIKKITITPDFEATATFEGMLSHFTERILLERK